mmetsp:Transcript_40055/g.73711  ORF Transcript_40055/g.73711 Transcript_40055/m.73711 type:complete len:317 (-) Transcript_40055:52-1002(-)
MKMTRALTFAAILGLCACAPDVQRTSLRATTVAPPARKVLPNVHEDAVVSKHPSVATKPVQSLKAPANNKAAAPKTAAVLKTAPKAKEDAKPKTVVKAATQLKAVSKPVAAAKDEAVVKPKAVAAPKQKAVLKAAPKAAAASVIAAVAARKPPAAKPTETPKAVHAVAKKVAAQPSLHAQVQVAAAAPAPSPASAPGAGDWREEYGHAKDPDQLKWKWTTNKPGSYDISQKATPKLKPIGEGAYQSAEAVAQRTKDETKDCEEGKWNDCYLKHGGDYVDSYKSGHLKGKYGNGAKAESGAATFTLSLAAFSVLFAF